MINIFNSLRTLSLIGMVFLFTNCLGMDNVPNIDPFAETLALINNLSIVNEPHDNQNHNPNNAQIHLAQDNIIQESNALENPEVEPNAPKPNEIIIYGTGNLFKTLEKKFNYNNTRLALLFSSAILAVISARSLLQKTTPKGKFLFASSILSFICNEQLATILSQRNGKISLAILAIAYFHKEMSKTLLNKEIFNRIYNQ